MIDSQVMRLRVKRAGDCLVAATALLGLSPIFAGIAAWIRFAEGRPVIFSQARTGQLGCPAFSGLLNLRSLCGELRIQVFGADFAWCPVAECGVNSPLIVEQFDVAGNVLLRFLP